MTQVLDGDLNAYRVRPVVDVTPVVLPRATTQTCAMQRWSGHLATLQMSSGILMYSSPRVQCHDTAGAGYDY